MKVDWLVVGAGFTGATIAERLASCLNQQVLIVEKRDHIAGNAYDYYNESGILTHRYGPHIFHTNSPHVWSYLSHFTRWRPYFHHVRGLIDGHTVPIPFNLNSLRTLFPTGKAAAIEQELLRHYPFGTRVPILKLRESENQVIRGLADFIYEKVFSGYTRKQWGLELEALDPAVTGRVPVHISLDNRYFQDKYQAMPSLGYTEMFRRMLRHENIRLLLNTDYRTIKSDIQYRHIVYSAPVDEFFDYKHGALPYRSLRFEFETLPKVTHQEVGTVNYPNDFDFTRVTEMKYLTGQRSSQTTIVTEFPEPFEPGANEPYYPIPRPENRDILELYKEEAKKLAGTVYFAGRLADYKYYNMDQAVARALSIFEAIKQSR